jgi:cation:H+ antiporter
LTWDLRLSRYEGVLLLLAGLSYFAYDFMHHARDRRARDVAEANQIREDIAGRLAWLHGKAGTSLQFALGAGIVIIGSRFLVDGAVSLAARLSIPPLLIGLTVVAVGTSLPELVTAVTSTRRNVSDLAVGNVLGANIANLTLIVGAAAVLSDVTLTSAAQRFNSFTLLAAFGLFLALLWTGQRLGRREGIALLVAYNLYIATLVLLGAALKD